MSTNSPISANDKHRSRVILLVAWALAALLLFLALRGIDWPTVVSLVRQARLEILLLVFLVFSGAYFLRGLRWRALLSAEKVLPPLTVFWGVSVGYLGNSFLPARAGEFIRSALIARRVDLNFGFTLATALTERVVDVPVLVILGLLALPVVPGIPGWLTDAVRVMTVVGVVGMASLLIAPRLDSQIAALIGRLPLPAGLHQPIIKMVSQFLQGARALQHPSRALNFFVLAVLIWGCDAIGAILTANAFGLTLTPAEAVLLLAALGLSSAVPSTPGFVGIYQFVALTVLPPFGFSQNSALAFILTFQAITYTVTVIYGLIGLRQLNGSLTGWSPSSSKQTELAKSP